MDILEQLGERANQDGLGGKIFIDAYDEIKRLREIETAARLVYDGLNARIDAAPSEAKPVFNGIAELHDALNR